MTFIVKCHLLCLVQGLKKKVATLYQLFQKIIRISQNFLNLLDKHAPLLIVKTSTLKNVNRDPCLSFPSAFALGPNLRFPSFLLFSVDYKIESTGKEMLLWTYLFRGGMSEENNLRPHFSSSSRAHSCGW